MYADEKGRIAVSIKQDTKEKKVCTDIYKPNEQKYQTDAKMQCKTQNVIATYCGEILYCRLIVYCLFVFFSLFCLFISQLLLSKPQFQNHSIKLISSIQLAMRKTALTLHNLLPMRFYKRHVKSN